MVNKTQLRMSRITTVNGEEHLIEIIIDRTEKLKNRIVTKKILKDDEGVMWDVSEEEVDISQSRDSFG